MKRLISLLSIVLVLSLLVAGCPEKEVVVVEKEVPTVTPVPPTPTPTATPTTTPPPERLRVAVPEWFRAFEEWQPLIEEFESENPQVELGIAYFPPEALATVAQSGEYDVVGLPYPPLLETQKEVAISEFALADLTPYESSLEGVGVYQVGGLVFAVGYLEDPLLPVGAVRADEMAVAFLTKVGAPEDLFAAEVPQQMVRLAEGDDDLESVLNEFSDLYSYAREMGYDLQPFEDIFGIGVGYKWFLPSGDSLTFVVLTNEDLNSPSMMMFVDTRLESPAYLIATDEDYDLVRIFDQAQTIVSVYEDSVVIWPDSDEPIEITPDMLEAGSGASRLASACLLAPVRSSYVDCNIRCWERLLGKRYLRKAWHIASCAACFKCFKISCFSCAFWTGYTYGTILHCAIACAANPNYRPVA